MCSLFKFFQPTVAFSIIYHRVVQFKEIKNETPCDVLNIAVICLNVKALLIMSYVLLRNFLKSSNLAQRQCLMQCRRKNARSNRLIIAYLSLSILFLFSINTITGEF
jgi:hypothetical protein